jgi:DNA-binding response OmpR family regulator
MRWRKTQQQLRIERKTKMKKIVLIEDDATMRTLLTTLLGMEEFNVIPMNILSENAIVEKIDSEHPNALLLDIHLRGGNGISILSKLRNNPSTKDLIILMTSGMDLSDECMKVGANGFLLKPYMPDELINWLHKKLD